MSLNESPKLSDQNVPTTGGRPRSLSNDSSSSKKSESKSIHKHVRNSKLTSVLRELKDDIVSDVPLKTINETDMCTLYGKDEVYIENHGKFIKTPKEALLDNEYRNSANYLEEPWRFDVTTSLDLAIMIQGAWSQFGKTILGILSGLAVTEVTLILLYMTCYKNRIFDYYIVYSVMASTFYSMYYILFAFSLISLLDWFDFAHINLKRLIDNLCYRKIWVIAFMYAAAVLILLSVSGMSTFIFLKCNDHMEKRSSREVLEKDDELIATIGQWNIASLTKNIIIIIGWAGLVWSKNEDLFLMHLIEMKKYDYTEDQLAPQPENHI